LLGCHFGGRASFFVVKKIAKIIYNFCFLLFPITIFIYTG
jgi:hypothetical protein